MTLQEKAREWAEKEYPTQPITTTIDSLAYNQRNLQNRNVAVNAYTAGASGAMEWIPVSEYDGDIREIEGINHFLIPIVDASGDFTEWYIVTGTPEDDTICGIDGIYHEVDVSQASHYMPVAKFPPHPEKEQL